MKLWKIFLWITLFVALTNLLVMCVHTTPDGRKYKIKETCLQGYYRDYYYVQQINNVSVPMIGQEWVCQLSKIDTVWIK